jgi:hypothetical protein
MELWFDGGGLAAKLTLCVAAVWGGHINERRNWFNDELGGLGGALQLPLALLRRLPPQIFRRNTAEFVLQSGALCDFSEAP